MAVTVTAATTTAGAIPTFDSGFHQKASGDGMLAPFFADGVPTDIELLGFSESQVLSFYKERSYQPSFWRSFGWDSSMGQAFEVLADAGMHALDPADYSSRGMSVAPQLGAREVDLAAFDVQATILFARYAHDAAIGRHNPSPSSHGLELLAEGLKASDAHDDQSFGQWLAEVAPNTPAYERLIRFYRHYEPAQATEIDPIPDGPLLRLGDEHPDVPLLRGFLVSTGIMDPSLASDSALFDQGLDDAIRSFQSYSGLKADGVVGNQTRGRLNQSNFDMLPKILVNLERLRWEDPLETDRFIRVNIADYHLHAYENRELALDMRVVVGRESRQTPLMSDRITNLKFAPDWTVPRSILKADYLSKIRSNPGFIASSGFQVRQGNRVVNAYSVNWSQPGIQNQVTLYRPSSSYGPLGGVRFSLTNDQAIYLHDTSSPYLFDRAERDRSSGCVRVQHPAALSKFILKNTDWSEEKIEVAMNGNDTQYARPSSDVQVYLSYLTLWIDDNGQLRTTNDPYNLDEALIGYFGG